MTDSSQRQMPGPGKPLTAQRELYLRLRSRDSTILQRVGSWGFIARPVSHSGADAVIAPRVSARILSRMNAPRLPIYVGRAGHNRRSRTSWAVIPRRSAGSYTATPIPTPTLTGPWLRTGAPWAAGRGRRQWGHFSGDANKRGEAAEIAWNVAR